MTFIYLYGFWVCIHDHVWQGFFGVSTMQKIKIRRFGALTSVLAHSWNVPMIPRRLIEVGSSCMEYEYEYVVGTYWPLLGLVRVFITTIERQIKHRKKIGSGNKLNTTVELC